MVEPLVQHVEPPISPALGSDDEPPASLRSDGPASPNDDDGADELSIRDADALCTLRLSLASGTRRDDVRVSCAERRILVQCGGPAQRRLTIDLPGDVDGCRTSFLPPAGGRERLRVRASKRRPGPWAADAVRVRRRRGRLRERPRRYADELPDSDDDDRFSPPVAPEASVATFLSERAAASSRDLRNVTDARGRLAAVRDLDPTTVAGRARRDAPDADPVAKFFAELRAEQLAATPAPRLAWWRRLRAFVVAFALRVFAVFAGFFRRRRAPRPVASSVRGLPEDVLVAALARVPLGDHRNAARASACPRIIILPRDFDRGAAFDRGTARVVSDRGRRRASQARVPPLRARRRVRGVPRGAARVGLRRGRARDVRRPLRAAEAARVCAQINPDQTRSNRRRFG